MAVKIVYHPAAVDVTLTFERGPVNFSPKLGVVGHDNVATDGSAVERIIERTEILISFEMPHLVIADDIEQWDAFMQFALPGGAFKLYPYVGFADYYNCQLADDSFAPKRNAVRKYGATVTLRILNDGQTPAGPSVVLRRFHGISN